MRVKIGNVERIVSESKGKSLVDSGKAEELVDVPVSIDKLKVPELKSLAKEKGIENADSMKRDELLEALEGCE